MPIISGHLKTMTTRTSAVAEVWVQSTEVMPRDKEVIVPETTKIPVDDGKVEFTAYPGRATIILVYMDSTPNAPIPIFITDEETQTIGDVITAGRDDEFQNPSEVENLIKQALEAVNRMQGTSDAAIAAAKEAKDSQDAAKVSEDNAKSSEESAAASAAHALGSQTAAKTSEDNAKKSEDASALSKKNAKASEDAAGTSERNAKESELAAKEARDQIEEFGVADGSVTDEKLSPELWEKIESGGVANAVSNINADGAGKLVKVGDNGRVTTDAPVDNADVANKGYVDGAVAKGGAQVFSASFLLEAYSGETDVNGGFYSGKNITKVSGDDFNSWCYQEDNGNGLLIDTGIYTISIASVRVRNPKNNSALTTNNPVKCSILYGGRNNFGDVDARMIVSSPDYNINQNGWYQTGAGKNHSNDASATVNVNGRTKLLFSTFGYGGSMNFALAVNIVKLR